MDNLKDLPLGFGMSLLQNADATMYFNSLTTDEQKRLIEKTHNVNSKNEMKAFIDTLRTQ